MKNFGLIGYPLTHSFSKSFFSKKFYEDGENDVYYHNYEIKNINDFNSKIKKIKNLCGLNVTIPYKEKVIPYLDGIDQIAEIIGSVNVIKISKNKFIGYNSDYLAFKNTLKKWLPNLNYSALIFGSGGSSKAVQHALNELGIPFKIVSRKSSNKYISYDDLLNRSIYTEYKLMINTTPLGMYPNMDSSPNINFDYINDKHFIYDLIYNPELTELLKKSKSKGANIKNGLEMLYDQANISWEIWNK